MMTKSILGINARNLSYILPFNKRKSIRLADSKLATKKLLIRTGISTPRLYAVFRTARDLDEFNWDKLPIKFVIKPNMGIGGEGIVILRSKLKRKQFIKLPLEKREWIKGSGEIWRIKDLKSHILDILDGNFSILGLPDIALIERELTRHPVFKKYIRRGVPDIRVIVYNKVPIMAMLRLPTKKSKGKANLAQGAVGVGIDLASGLTTYAMIKRPRRKIIFFHPDTGMKLRDLEIPFWDEILKMSIEVQIASGLGFLGVDIALDKKYGPQVLEINARPGLDIQIANLEGLEERLRRVKGLSVKTVSRGLRLAKELFGGDIERRVEEISGKEVIGIIEKVRILNKRGTRQIEVEAKVDTGAAITSIDRDLAARLGFLDAIKFYESFNIHGVLSSKEIKEPSKKKIWKKLEEHEDIIGVVKTRSAHGATYRILIPLTFYLSDKKIISKASIVSRRGLEYPIIIGRRDLKDFLVDPSKKLVKTMVGKES